MWSLIMSYDLVVIGTGPGGYVCAIRAAQLGLKTAVRREAQDAWRHLPQRRAAFPRRRCCTPPSCSTRRRAISPRMGIEVGEPKLDLTKMQPSSTKASTAT